MAVIFYIFFWVFASLFAAAYAKKHGLRPSWAWAHPSRLLPRLASPLCQLPLVFALYLLLRLGHTPPYSALMACILMAGAFGLVSLSIRAAVALYGQVSTLLLGGSVAVPAAASQPVELAEHPDSLAYRASRHMEKLAAREAQGVAPSQSAPSWNKNAA